MNMQYREELAEAIEGYIDNEIDNYGLDEVISAGNAADVVGQEIAAEVWFFYDDCNRHFNEGKLKLDEGVERSMRRWIFLLKSGEEWRWTARHTGKAPSNQGFLSRLLHWAAGRDSFQRRNEYWPWDDESDWRRWKEEVSARIL